MSLTMQEIDSFIDTTINRLSGANGTMVSNFYVGIRESNPDRQRITQGLVNQDIALCQSRGIYAERQQDGLMISVDLNRCFLNQQQSVAFNTALEYTRQIHGNSI